MQLTGRLSKAPCSMPKKKKDSSAKVPSMNSEDHLIKGQAKANSQKGDVFNLIKRFNNTEAIPRITLQRNEQYILAVVDFNALQAVDKKHEYIKCNAMNWLDPAGTDRQPTVVTAPVTETIQTFPFHGNLDFRGKQSCSPPV